jgi:hypothetical protein
MRKIVVLSLASAICTMLVTSCAPRGGTIDAPCQKGMFCYKNINFGVSKGKYFEKGVKDGCKTAEGTFRKDYYYSSRDKNYYDGWILGRSKCKQILPNEGTRLEEQKSKQRAEYQIRQMRMEKEQQPEVETIVDSILDSSNDIDESIDVEY